MKLVIKKTKIIYFKSITILILLNEQTFSIFAINLIKMSDKTYLPAEWEKQQFIQLTWPHEETDWAYMLDEVEACFVNIANAITRFEHLLIVCRDVQKVKAFFPGNQSAKITFVELPSNDTWARDHGGITIIDNGRVKILDFCFNGWGKKFDATLDNQITKNLFEKGIFGEVNYVDCLNFVLEGGSIESDGKGVLLTTSQCLLSDNRNDINQDEVEKRLKSYFNLKKVLWLDHGYLAGDDTDSHVDTLARLCDENTIAYVKCEDRQDGHFEELNAMEEELKLFRNDVGEPYKLIPLPMADAVYEEGERLPATYANFLIINDAVLMPTYYSPKDIIAQKQLQEAFPDREIIGIDCIPLIKQHGSLHCVTMQYY